MRRPPVKTDGWWRRRRSFRGGIALAMGISAGRPFDWGGAGAAPLGWPAAKRFGVPEATVATDFMDRG